MAIIKDAGRQNLLYATQKITQAMLANTDGAYDAIDLPPGARFVSGALVEDVAFDDGTASTLSVGISGGAADAYLAATGVQQGAGTVTALTGGSLALLPSGQTINVTAAFTGEDATVGEVTLIVAYIIDGRSTEAQ
jgi:hypothetical protein